jgi:hypothetical protein
MIRAPHSTQEKPVPNPLRRLVLANGEERVLEITEETIALRIPKHRHARARSDHLLAAGASALSGRRCAPARTEETVMTRLDILAIGVAFGVLFYFALVRTARLLVARLDRRADAARVRRALAAVADRVIRARPRGGFDMPPQDIVRKQFVESLVLGGSPMPAIVLNGGLKS